MAFTLIELLVVIAIIGVLMGLIVGMADFARRKAMEGKARTEMHDIAEQLDKYLLDRGKYPAGSGMDFLDSKLDLKKELREGADIFDPWGNKYEYECKTEKPLAYTLYSRGPDGNDKDQPLDDVYPER